MDDQLQSEQARWEEETLQPALEEFPERKERFTTSSGIPVERVYLAAHDDPDYLERLGFPASIPLRGACSRRCTGGRLWTMRQYAGFGTAAESTRATITSCAGANRPLCRFPLPTQNGYNPKILWQRQGRPVGVITSAGK